MYCFTRFIGVSQIQQRAPSGFERGYMGVYCLCCPYGGVVVCVGFFRYSLILALPLSARFISVLAPLPDMLLMDARIQLYGVLSCYCQFHSVQRQLVYRVLYRRVVSTGHLLSRPVTPSSIHVGVGFAKLCVDCTIEMLLPITALRWGSTPHLSAYDVFLSRKHHKPGPSSAHAIVFAPTERIVSNVGNLVRLCTRCMAVLPRGEHSG